MSGRAAAPPVARDWAAPALVAAGTVALAIRPVAYASLGATMLVGALGLLAPVRRSHAVGGLAAFAVGTAAFAVARALGAPVGVRFTALGIVSISIAAVCEETFFRRFVYGWLDERWGVAAALLLSSALFALAHLPTYGWGAMPIDLAAGGVLGWQRWASGGWAVPAFTHVIANLMQMG